MVSEQRLFNQRFFTQLIETLKDNDDKVRPLLNQSVDLSHIKVNVLNHIPDPEDIPTPLIRNHFYDPYQHYDQEEDGKILRTVVMDNPSLYIDKLGKELLPKITESADIMAVYSSSTYGLYPTIANILWMYLDAFFPLTVRYLNPEYQNVMKDIMEQTMRRFYYDDRTYDLIDRMDGMNINIVQYEYKNSNVIIIYHAPTTHASHVALHAINELEEYDI